MSAQTARVMFPDGDTESMRTWVEGMAVHAEGTDVVIGHVISTGVDDDGRAYAEIEMTPAGLGVGYERPRADAEEDPFG